MAELTEQQLQGLYYLIIQEFKYKKLEIEKKLDGVVNKKITKIEKDCKKFKDASIYFGNGYIGQKNKYGMPHGMGNLLFNSTEDMYVGQFDSGLKHGLGKYTYFSGGGSAHHPFTIPYYSGEWFADLYHGLGKDLITDYEDLMIYEGTHTNDKKTGFGTYKKFNNDNIEKVCNTELIGYFLDGQGHEMIIEINRKDNGKLSENIPSGLFQFDDKNKTPVFIFHKIEDWENLKPKKFTNELSNLFNNIYESYFSLETFTKEFTDLKYNAKKEVMGLMFGLDKFFEAKNSHASKIMKKVNIFNKDINQADKSEQLIKIINEVKETKKEFDIIKKS